MIEGKNLSEIANEVLYRKPMNEYCDKDRFEMYTLGFKDGYDKANEWKYVKNGDLPKTHGWYWVQYNNGTFDCNIVTKDLRFFNFYTDKDMTEAVYAWKEIERDFID